MARLHDPAPGITSVGWMSVIAWGTAIGLFAFAGLAFAGGMGWL